MLQQTGVPDVKHLVRSELGCACPDHVFEHIDILEASSRFADLPGDYLIAVGNRLLLLVVGSASWREVAARLERLFTRGRELRDSQGFNRFRLVVAVGEVAAARAELAERFAALPDRDDRMHLHVIRSEVLAAHGLVKAHRHISEPR